MKSRQSVGSSELAVRSSELGVHKLSSIDEKIQLGYLHEIVRHRRFKV